VNLIESLKEGVRGASETTLRNRTRSLLVVFESAIAVMLLIAAGLLVRSLIALQSVDPGFDANNVLTMRLDLARNKYDTPEKTANFLTELQNRAGNLPGVETVGLITELPLSGQLNDVPFTVEGRPPVTIDQAFDADFRRINQNYFSALRIPLLRGRNFSDQEVRQDDEVVIVSQQLVNQVFPNEEPLGKRLVTVMGDTRYEIIGVVSDIRHQSLAGGPVPTMYFPTIQSNSTNVVIRTKSDPMSVAAGLRKEIQAIDPDQPVAAVKPMTAWVDASVSSQRYRTTLLGLFAVLAMVLAATGIYGVMSYTVAQRTHEIGVRMALGAQQGNVLKLVVRQGMVLAVIGVALGLIGAFALTRVMASLLFQVTARDPITFAVVAALLIAVAFLACFVPALRATKVDPLVALRYE
jgi:putative ABC transport system permease protein